MAITVSRVDTARPNSDVRGLPGPLPVDLGAVQSDLRRAIALEDEGQALQELCGVVRRLFGAKYVGLCRANDLGQFVTFAGSHAARLVGDPSGLDSRLAEWARQACEARVLGVQRLATGEIAIAIPVEESPVASEALVALLNPGQDAPEVFVALAQLVVGYVSLLHTQRDARRLEAESASLSFVLNLASRIGEIEDDVDACRTLADALAEYLQLDCVAIGRVTRPGAPVRLVAINGTPDFDRQSDFARGLEAALHEALPRQNCADWPSSDDQDAHALLAHAHFSQLHGYAALHSRPWRNGQGEVVGAWLVGGSPEVLKRPVTRTLLAVAGEPFAASLESLRRHRARRSHRMLAWMRGWGAWNLALGALLLASAGLALPAAFRVRCDCEVQPQLRRHVVAPFDGLLERSLVRAGDLVVEGQPLALMDGRELRWELASILADRERAAKSHDVNRAARKVAAAQIDAMEVERLDFKRRLLESRLARLEIKSPLAGVVVTNELERSAGAPLKSGQHMLEVAPLEGMLAELAIEEQEVGCVSPGQQVEVRLEAFPDQVFAGRVATLHPRAEIRDEKNVFVAEVMLDNAASMLRPGMRGTARVLIGRRSTGWIWFHEPWRRVIRWFRSW